MLHLNFKRYGKGGTPLIILHGLFGSLDNWHTLAKRFSEEFETYTIDQRNHGKSPHTEDQSYKLMARDLRDFMDQQQIKKANLLGHSMGGKTVLQFAMDYPERIHSIIVADIGPKVYPPRHDEIIHALKSVDLSKVNRRKDAEEQLGQYIQNEGIKLFLLKNMNRNEDGSYSWKMNLPVLEKNYNKLSAAIPMNHEFQKPALFLRGEKSSYILNEDKDEIRKYFPQVQFITLKNAGHWLHADVPKVFGEVVMNFIWQVVEE